LIRAHDGGAELDRRGAVYRQAEQGQRRARVAKSWAERRSLRAGGRAGRYWHRAATAEAGARTCSCRTAPSPRCHPEERAELARLPSASATRARRVTRLRICACYRAAVAQRHLGALAGSALWALSRRAEVYAERGRSCRALRRCVQARRRRYALASSRRNRRAGRRHAAIVPILHTPTATVATELKLRAWNLGRAK
jgi:hypothetical protein